MFTFNVSAAGQVHSGKQRRAEQGCEHAAAVHSKECTWEAVEVGCAAESRLKVRTRAD